AAGTVLLPGHSVTVAGLAAATTYSFAVFARDSGGAYSSASAITVKTAPPTTTGSISGTVTDSAQNPLQNVTVSLYADGSSNAIAETSTTSTGRYTFTTVAPGHYDTCFSATANTTGGLS